VSVRAGTGQGEAMSIRQAPAGERRTPADPTVLFVANFGTNTGYAWDTIERVFAGVAQQLEHRGLNAAVAYADFDGGAPRSLEGTSVRAITFDYRAAKRSAGGTLAFLRLLRRERVRVLYLTDQPTWSLRYALFRLAGVRRILVHDRTSGVRDTSALARRLKTLIHHLPLLPADRFIAVSGFVRQRLVRVNGTPADRTVTVYNGIPLARFAESDPGHLSRELGVDPARPVILCSGRMQSYKGIQVALRAVRSLRDRPDRPLLVVCGAGPDLDGFRELAARLELGDAVLFTGRRNDVPRLLAGATVSVVPSLWAEAFGLTVVEAMAAGVPVVASEIGGIPELVDPDRTGVLVPPGDADALAVAVAGLLDAPERRARIGRAAARAARERFSAERTVQEIARQILTTYGSSTG